MAHLIFFQLVMSPYYSFNIFFDNECSLFLIKYFPVGQLAIHHLKISSSFYKESEKKKLKNVFQDFGFGFGCAFGFVCLLNRGMQHEMALFLQLFLEKV